VRRILTLASAIVFVDTVFYAAITPLLPQFAEEFGLSKTGAGILVAAYAAGTFAGALPGGWLAARAGVRATVLVGLTLTGASSLAFAFAPNVIVLDLARFLQGVGGAFSWAGAFGWLVGAAPAERRGEVIGSAMAAAIVGALVGPAFGAAAAASSPEAVFSSIAVATGVLAVFALRTPPVAPEHATRLRDLLAAMRQPLVVGGMWLTTLPGLLFGTLGRLLPVIAGLAAATVLVALLPWPNTAWLLGAAVIASAPAIGTLWTPAIALLSDGAERLGLEQAFAFALLNLSWSIGDSIGAAGGGRLGQAAGDELPYLILAALCALTLAGAVAAAMGRTRTAASGPAAEVGRG
jgi:MFS family permease